jgi:hypothetical protein
MGVRKTETRLPAGLTAADLGESVISPDGRCCLISFNTAPLAASRPNSYMVFVTDAGLAATVESYQWSITEDGFEPYSETTTVGEFTYLPVNAGNLGIDVQLLDGSDKVLASLSMSQELGGLNPTIEDSIAAAAGQAGPGAGNPDVLRELVNEYYTYYQGVHLKTPEADDSFKRFVCGVLFDGVLKYPAAKRKDINNEIAATLTDNPAAFSTAAGNAVGPAALRLAVLAMNYPVGSPLLPWTELPDGGSANALADELLRQKLDALAEDNKIDLVNIARFPKTNIAFCAAIIENLRDKYFAGASFKDVLTGMNGTREHWITKHYTTGPIAK